MNLTLRLSFAPALLLPLACGAQVEPTAKRTAEEAPAPLAIHFERGDTLCLMGGALAERMQHHGWLELRLQERFPDRQLRLRNLGFSADELSVHQRTQNFGKFSADGMQSSLPNERFVPWDRYLDHTDARVIFAFFGYNESFAGQAGLPAFEDELRSFIAHVGSQEYSPKGPAQLVLFSSIPHEDLGDPNLPDGREANQNIAAYNRSMQAVASELGVRFVDLFEPMLARYASAPESLTINGIHLNEAGDRALAAVIDKALFGSAPERRLSDEQSDRLREAILEKNHLWFNRYRATDGYNVYGDRSRLTYVAAKDGRSYSNFEVLQREMDHLDGLVAARDAQLWDLAQGGDGPIDTSGVLPLLSVETNKPGAGTGGAHQYLASQAELEVLTPAPGMRVKLFADERQFPELVNPVQMAWDTRGRLWVAVWPTYPHWQPDREMNDKLLILEDTDGDGRADDCTVFAGDLHNPTGFEFWNGGVLLASQPDLLFLKDTDGDDRADHTERLLHGLSSADTHHAANSFVIGPDGALYFQEGTFHRSQVESIYGPMRQRGACAWRFDPRTWRVERYIPYGFANPHGHVFDAWGQDFITDGTGNANYYALGFSGHLPQPKNHSRYFTFFAQRTRPAGGTEILSSGHFPEANQGNYLIANVIGFRGIHQYEVFDQDSGFGAREVEPIVESSSQNFRPVDIEVGPDGAIYFLDWHNALIGHMQHHLRDPSRDAAHGRVYRVTSEGRPLLRPAPIAGRPIEELLELLKSPEDRTRYRVRLELSGRDSDEVVAAAKSWVHNLDASEPGHLHHRLEALWLHQQHNRIDRELLLSLLGCKDYRARAAATRVVRHGRHLLPDALELLRPRVLDEHPRVRLEAVVAASFLGGAPAASLALEALKQPMDKFLDYALQETMRGLEDEWTAALRAGEPLATGNPAGIEYLLERVDAADLGSLPHIPSVLSALLTRHGVAPEARVQAASELAELRGTSPADELFAAMWLVDASTGSHADHVLHQLHALLGQLAGGALGAQGPARGELLRQAETGVHTSMRSLGYAALVNLDGVLEPALESAMQSGPRLLAFLDAVQHIEAPELRASLWPTLEGLCFEVPEQLGRSGPGTGLEVSFYEPRPRDASRQSFAALSPAQRTSAPTFTLEVPPARSSDSFGLAFNGTLFVPADGTYRFNTTSDDGSRLFIDGQLVVNNDGDHGPLTKSGELELSAGAHGIQVNYYEAGGGETLTVRWSGPGLEEEELPASVLGSGLAARLRAAAARALGHLPGRELPRLALVQRLLVERAELGATLDLLGSLGPVLGRVAATDAGAATLSATSAALLSRLGELPPEQRTSPEVARAIQLGHGLAAELAGEEARSARAALDSLGGLSLVIRTLPHQMRYDVTEFEVQAGKPVSILFENNDMMPHNLVICVPGSLAEVGQAAEALSGSGASAEFIPETESVLWHTGLVLPGQSARLDFVAPAREGEHPYVCTYPGHWRVMNGVMRVVPEGTQPASLERSAEGAAAVALRPFVKDWVLAELAPHLVEGWEAQASAERGKPLFEAAGCIKCHSVDEGPELGGPKLSSIQAKEYQGLSLLEHILEPSKEVLEDYRFYVFKRQGKGDLIGRILKEDGEILEIMPNLLESEEVLRVPKSSISSRFDTQLSPMPTGLLVTLEAQEILDLLLFLQTPTHP